MRLPRVSLPPIITPPIRPWITALVATLLLLPGAVLFAAPLPAMAQITSQEGIALRNQILRLRQEVDALRARVDNSGGSYLGGGRAATAAPATSAGTSDVVVHLLDRMNTIDDEIRTLRGQIDEMQNDQGQKIADLEQKLGDLKFEVEHPGATPPASPAGPAPAGREAGPRVPERLPQHLPARPAESPAEGPSGARAAGNPLQAAYAALDRHDYPTAAREAHAVLARRAAPGAYDAQFVFAEALAGQHEWSRAAIAYDDAYNRSKRGAHAPAALLGLAQSLAAINERRASCETLAKLHAQFPREGAALRSQAVAVAHRAGCR